MTQSAKAHEPSMEEILASIRRIIADDDATRKPPEPPKPAVRAVPPAPPKPVMAPPPPPPPEPEANTQDDIDAMLADLDAPPGQAAEPESDVLDLTEAMAAPTPVPGPAPSFRTIDGESDIVFSDREPELAAPPPPPPPEPPRTVMDEARRNFSQGAPDRQHLLSTAATAAVDSAFNALAHTVLVQNARTLEDLVKEMLRPMLKAWLDDNLPNLVERIVRTEIERVSRGRS